MNRKTRKTLKARALEIVLSVSPDVTDAEFARVEEWAKSQGFTVERVVEPTASH